MSGMASGLQLSMLLGNRCAPSSSVHRNCTWQSFKVMIRGNQASNGVYEQRSPAGENETESSARSFPSTTTAASAAAMCTHNIEVWHLRIRLRRASDPITPTL